MKDKPKIIIAKADEKEVANIPPGGIKEKFERIDQVLYGIVFVLILSVIAIIISVMGLFLDQMRYNNIAYQDYSEKLDILTLNQELLKQNQQSQKQILELQKQLSRFTAEGKKNEKNVHDIRE